MKKSHIVTTRSGESLKLYQAQDGHWCCPVCGSPELTQPPYSGSGAASFEMCSCGFEFGFDDDPGASAEALPTVSENLERWRSNVVKQVRGSEDKYKQLRAQLAAIEVTDV